MIAEADVFIQNLMPGAMDRLGFSMEKLRADQPSLITCSISGYGNGGAYSQMKAYDLLIQAECGLAAITGSPAEPGRVGVSICDIAAGMTSLSGDTSGTLRPPENWRRPSYRRIALPCTVGLDECSLSSASLWRQDHRPPGASSSYHCTLRRLSLP